MNERRTTLLEFQAQLSERLREAATGPGSNARLGLQVGSRSVLVELSEAGEIVPMPAAIAPVPSSHDWFRGLVNLRGSLYAVSDLARFMGEEATAMDRQTRLVAFSPRLGMNGAILAARVLGLHAPETMRPAAPARGDGPPWLGKAWHDREGRCWRELSLRGLAGDARFLAVARESAD